VESQGQARWPYLAQDSMGIPALGVAVVGPLEPHPPETPIRVDTGYDGFLLLSEEEYGRLGLNLAELPRRYWPEAETVTSEVFKLRRALTIVQVPRAGIELEGYVDTFRENRESLVGLTFLENLNLLLEGPTRHASIPNPQASLGRKKP